MTIREQIRLSGPASLISAIPYQLGFHPQNSVVMVCLHDKRVGLIQRIDIPPLEHVVEATAAMVAPMTNDNPTSIFLIGYEDVEGDSGPMLVEIMTVTTVTISDMIVVRNGRWYSLTCTDPSCCPPEGTEITTSPPEVAQFVAHGVNPLASREYVAARLEPVPGAVTTLPTHGPLSVTPEALAAWTKILTTGNITLTEAKNAAGALECVDFRDGLLATIVPGTLDFKLVSDEVLEHLATLPKPDDGTLKDNLIDLCADLADTVAAPALTVLATYVWNLGDGAVTRLALDRALRCDPHYRLAQLVERMVDLCIRPTRDGD